ncbi:uncharacterized protein C1orf94 homolog [Gallus gallus]|uniref:Chromosome 1 open reading frame 94 n=1 Tax=Gallus gallus TaxID=9031 RepID=A0A8V0YZH2_CHICK|nr:uncharacterized protein C1orf94 homolog [Gallus gallus]XP_417787.4 uncharacterized protein C1orf94 homolog [Gallus gallus]
MLSGMNSCSGPAVKSEGPFPLGPFPRHIWIHDNTPQDGLDKACHEIWKRTQSLPWELQPIVCTDPPGPPWSRNGAHSGDWLLNETEGLESLYRAVIGNREREMKLRALCDAQLSAKSTITNLLHSASSSRSSKGLGDSSTTGAGSTEGSKLGMPLLLKHTDIAKGPDRQVMAEESKTVKDFLQNGMFSAAKNSTAVPAPMAECQTAGQKQQLSTVAKICSRPDSSAATKALQNPVTTAVLDKKMVLYNASASTPRFSATTTTTTLNQPMWPSLSFPPLPLFPNQPNFSPFQGPYQRARIPFQQALHPSFGCYSRQGAPFSPQMFRSPYTPLLNYIPLVQPGFPHQRAPLQLPTSIQDLPAARDGMRFPFPPPYGFGAAPGGAVRATHHYPSNGSCINF